MRIVLVDDEHLPLTRLKPYLKKVMSRELK